MMMASTALAQRHVSKNKQRAYTVDKLITSTHTLAEWVRYKPQAVSDTSESFASGQQASHAA